MWKKVVFVSFLFLISFQLLYSQNDNVGSGRALSLNGINDYVNFGDRYSDLNFPFTISAWIYLRPSSSSSPIFVSRNNNPLYNGFWFIAYESYIFIEYGDGFGGNNPAFRAGKIADVTGLIYKWNYVTAVVNGTADIELYLNGVNVGGYSTGESNSPMVSMPNGKATAGYFLSNDVSYYSKAIVDDIRFWKKSLTQDEIRQTMCVKLTGNEPGLIGYWDFNEISGDTIYDKSPNKFHGKFVGNPKRVFSGAPIGDVSTFQYSTAWSGNIVSLQDGDHRIDAKNISGNVMGIQIYEVKSAPSQTGGLNPNNNNEPYFGVFLVDQSSNGSFDAYYYFQNNGTCRLYQREDNSISEWSEANDNPIIQKFNRAEVLSGFGTKASFDLGVDKNLCDKSICVISTEITDPQFTFKWNTGQTTPSISVSETGLYSVKVFGYCGVAKDSVSINFGKTPKPFSLGIDSQSCVFIPKILQPVSDPDGLTFLWQDGSTNPTFNVDSFGEFWVTVKSSCGEESDSVNFSKLRFPTDKIPNLIIPNGDHLNEIFSLDNEIVGLVSLRVFNRWGGEVYYSPAYKNDWGGEDVSSGVYYIVLEGICIEKTKGTLHIIK
jgi:hypothetical protein